MTTTLIIEPMNNHCYSFPYEETQSTTSDSYFKFYQLKLRQLLTENKHRSEQSVKHTKRNRSKTPVYHKRQYEDYMNRLREVTKIQLQNEHLSKSPDSVLSEASRSKIDSSSAAMSTSYDTPTIVNECRPKSILKTRKSLTSTKAPRSASAPAKKPKSFRKKVRTKVKQIEFEEDDDDDDDDCLSKANCCSYTQASSSSCRSHSCCDQQYAQKSILNSVISHLNSYTPSDTSKWNVYQDFNEKFSASISPTLYREFERIIL